MLPVEPSPFVMGTIGLPSTLDADFDFFAFALASLGAKRLPPKALIAESPDKNERRLQADFKFITSLPLTLLDSSVMRKTTGSVTPRRHFGYQKECFTV